MKATNLFACAGALLLVLASGALPSSSLAGEAEWSAHTKAAMAAYWRGDHLGAAKSFADALKEAQGFPETDRRLASTINNLALLYARQGRHADAEALYVRAVSLDEKTLGQEHPDLAATLNNVAELYRAQARYDEAEPLYRRSLAIVEKALGANHTQAGTTLNNLAELYRAQGRGADAEPLYRRALAIREKAHGPNHPDVAATLGQLAELYRAHGQFAQAEPLYRRSLQIEEQVFGPEHPDVAATLMRQGDLYRAMSRPADAEPLYRRALAIRERAFGAEHLEVARTLGGMADMYLLQGRLGDAETAYARALRILEQVLGAEHAEVGANLHRQALVLNAQGKRELALATVRRASSVLAQRVAQGEHRPWVGVFEDHVRLLAAAAETAPAQLRSAALAEGFAAAQTARAAGAVAQSARLTARYAGSGDALARYARARLDALVRLKQLDTQYLQAVVRPPRDRDAATEERLREESTRTRNAFMRLDARPEGDAGRQADLASPRPLELREVQQHLGADEALAMLLVLPERSFLWLVRGDTAGFYPLALRQDDLATMVGRLGSQLDARGEHRPTDPSPYFDVALAHELYRSVFAPAEGLLAGVKHLMIVPDGALASLPPGVLVAALPAKPLATMRDHAQVEWLVKRHALTMLNSVASLHARSQDARPSAAREAFRGFGEFPALAGALKLSPDTLMRGAQATESAIKGVNLARFRALAFVAPGSLQRRTAEPALALAAPQSPNALDDGMLTASEIAQLRLDADWVLLAGSAPPDQAAADARAALARSFIHAGARSVLVSYGGANAQAVAEITGRAAEESAAGAPRAEALRRSMLAFMTAAGDPQRAHPRYWAGMTVTGEGNARWSDGRRPGPVVAETTPAAKPPAESAQAAAATPAAAPQTREDPVAKAVAAVTGFLGQLGRGRDSTPQEAKPEPQPEVKPSPSAQPQAKPQPKPAAAPPPPQPQPVAAPTPPPQPQVQPQPVAVPPPPPVVAAPTPPPPQPVAAPPPSKPQPVALRAEPAPVAPPAPEPAAANPVAAAIEGVGEMLRKMFAPPVQSPSEPVAAAGSDSGTTTPNWTSASAADAAAPSPSPAPATAAADGDDPVSRIIRDVSAALARLVAPASGTQAPAASAAPVPEKEQVAAVALPATPAGTQFPTQSPPAAEAPASGQDPVAAIFKEIGALMTRLQLALNLQRMFEGQPSPRGNAPVEAPVYQGPVAEGTVLTMDGRPVLSAEGNPVSSAKFDPAPAVQANTADDPVALAIRTMGEFLRRLLGGETGTKPAQ